MKIDWLDKIIGDVCSHQDLLVLSRKEEQLEDRPTELLGEIERV